MFMSGCPENKSANDFGIVVLLPYSDTYHFSDSLKRELVFFPCEKCKVSCFIFPCIYHACNQKVATISSVHIQTYLNVSWCIK